MVFSISLIHGLKFGLEFAEDARGFGYILIDVAFVRLMLDLNNDKRS